MVEEGKAPKDSGRICSPLKNMPSLLAFLFYSLVHDHLLAFDDSVAVCCGLNLNILISAGMIGSNYHASFNKMVQVAHVD